MVGGELLAGLTGLARSPYLAGIATLVACGSLLGMLVYIELARAAATGFAIGNNVLIIAGALEGAGGFILSMMMLPLPLTQPTDDYGGGGWGNDEWLAVPRGQAGVAREAT